jgi:hypothetical protein
MPVYRKGQSPVNKMDRLPMLGIKEVVKEIGGSRNYDSYRVALEPQTQSTDFRGEIYLKSLTVTSRRDSTIVFTAVWRSETLRWLQSAFLKRDKKWDITFGWTDKPETIRAFTGSIDVKLDSSFGGFDLTLVLYENGLYKAHSIGPTEKTIQEVLQDNRKTLTYRKILTAFTGVLKKVHGVQGTEGEQYTYFPIAGDDYVLNESEIKYLERDTNKNFLKSFQDIVNRRGERVYFNSIKKEVSIINNDYDDPEGDSKWVFEYKTYDTEIYEIDFNLFADGTSVNEIIETDHLLQEKGAIEKKDQIIKGKSFYETPTLSEQEVYSAGSNYKAYQTTKKEIYLVPIRTGSIVVIGNTGISLGDKIELRGIDPLSGFYKVLDAEHEIVPGNFKTTLKLVGPTEVPDEPEEES